jgi:hypothetical protein
MNVGPLTVVNWQHADELADLLQDVPDGPKAKAA